jgi:hypothetical protein
MNHPSTATTSGTTSPLPSRRPRKPRPRLVIAKREASVMIDHDDDGTHEERRDDDPG